MDIVTKNLNVSPHYITPTDEGMISSLEKLAYHQEEPFGSASIYVQYCVMELAKKNNVTVLLDGQGADEILAGYHGYYAQYFDGLKKTNPIKYRLEVESYEAMHATSTINKNIRGSKFERLKSSIGVFAPELRSLYKKIKNDSNTIFDKEFYNQYKSSSFTKAQHFESLNHRLYSSTMKQGLQELLRYADRNSMAHSREIRLPFLNHELVEFIFSLPDDMKIRHGWTKWIMRQTFQNVLPQEITWRKDKIGYEPPQKNWMENKEINEQIYAAKETMIDKGIFAKRLLHSNSVAEKGITNASADWKYFMCSSIINSVKFGKVGAL